ncbi:hypothetical protein PACTADRAFT_4439 [Pachysolen tannophilus NRRL Y-2460]|uniref:SPX domain-containing protein n=1 Tax=Pachysolen tannophilus NRRL Y-2460 TaxID=669874 RepID=A0A1E4TRX0_PACTA|nr:hypothetical protein PACTADRAFT_4439 [Pachysolen tannophilus NRRL Y-2460]
MKFSHSLQFNAVPEWSSKYIAYSSLKKTIYQLQRENLNNGFGDRYDPEQQPLNHSLAIDNHMTEDDKNPIKIFTNALDTELQKIDLFYKNKEAEIYTDCQILLDDIDDFERTNKNDDENSMNAGYDGSSNRRSIRALIATIQPVLSNNSSQAVLKSSTIDNPSNEIANGGSNNNNNNNLVHVLSNSSLQNSNYNENSEMSYTLDSDDDDLLNHRNNRKITNQRSDILEDSDFDVDFLRRVALSTRKRTIDLFVKLSELKSYIELNKIGFTKALKKFDKSLNVKLRNEYLSQLPLKSYIFQESTLKNLNDKIHSIVKIYAFFFTRRNNLPIAENELRSHLREHVVWDRDTVWREMIGLERKTHSANVDTTASGNRVLIGDEGNILKETPQEKININICSKTFTIPKFLVSSNAIKGYIIAFITVVLLFISPFEDKEQQKCFSILVCASLLWATETIPLFITSLLVPLLIVTFGVLKDPDTYEPLSATEASKYVFSTMWSSVIMLLVGGFTLAAALSKYNIAKVVSTWVLSKAGTNPKIMLLTIMSVALFASMWVSNVAAPVLCFSIIQPLLRTLPKNSEFSKALILGIALSSNIGGMASPIASPQNVIAIGYMDPSPSWGQWFVIALPVCAISLVAIWMFLIVTMRAGKGVNLVPIRVSDDKFTSTQWYISFVTILTIILWCFASKLESVFGEMGMIAIIPLLLFYGPGFLTTDDINNYPWNIVILAMGGIALGKAVSSSGLLQTIALGIRAHVEHFQLYSIMLIFGLLILTVATFVSHTVAALIIIPLIQEIGNTLPDPHPRLLVMASTLLCSAAMGLPTSGFPNVTAICMVDDVGVPYLTVGKFITRGVPSSFMAYLVIVTFGFGIMKLIGF